MSRRTKPTRKRGPLKRSHLKPLNNLTLQIAIGKTAKSHKIEQQTISLKEFFNKLKQPNFQHKKDGPYYILASFKENVRNAQNVLKYYGAVIDLDDTDLTLPEVQAKFSKFTYCIHTTYSHTLEGKGNRYRVVIPYESPIDVNAHVDLVYYFQNRIGSNSFDIAVKAISLPTYFPAVNEENKDNFKCMVNRGILFDPFNSKIQEVLARVRFEQMHIEERQPIDITSKVEEGDRNVAVSRAVGKFISMGVRSDELHGMVKAYNEQNISPPLAPKELKIIVNSVLQTHTKNHNDLSWGFSEMIRRINDSPDIREEFAHLCKMIAHAKNTNSVTAPEMEMLVNDLKSKAKVGKNLVQQEITKASLELQGQSEAENEKLIEQEADTLRKRFKDWVYVSVLDRMYNTYNGVTLTREAFSTKFHSKTLKTNMFSVLNKYNLVNKVDRVEFDPEEEPVYTRARVSYVNSYIDPLITPRRGSVAIILKHFRYLFPKRQERKIILDFIAHLVQFPGRKIRWMLVIKGSKGIGKSVIAESLIMNLIGYPNVGKVSNQLIKGEFNAWQADTQLLVFEELDTGNTFAQKKALTDRLKELITDNLTKIHRKGVDPYDTVNKACCIGFTNVEEPVIITPDERRFCMLKTAARPRTGEYYQRFVDFCEQYTPEIYHYFMNRNLDGFQIHTAPYTEYTQELKFSSMQWPKSILFDLAQGELDYLFPHGVIAMDTIIEIIKARSTGQYKLNAETLATQASTWNKRLVRDLRELDFRPWTGPYDKKNYRYTVHGKKQTIWILPKTTQGQLNKLVCADLKQIFESVEINENTLIDLEFDKIGM